MFNGIHQVGMIPCEWIT